MLALTPEAFAELTECDADVSFDPSTDNFREPTATMDELVREGLVFETLVAEDDDYEYVMWRTTERGALALRVHRAALAAGVVA